jgi:hypothetical protein
VTEALQRRLRHLAGVDAHQLAALAPKARWGLRRGSSHALASVLALVVEHAAHMAFRGLDAGFLLVKLPAAFLDGRALGGQAVAQLVQFGTLANQFPLRGHQFGLEGIELGLPAVLDLGGGEDCRRAVLEIGQFGARRVELLQLRSRLSVKLGETGLQVRRSGQQFDGSEELQELVTVTGSRGN